MTWAIGAVVIEAAALAAAVSEAVIQYSCSEPTRTVAAHLGLQALAAVSCCSFM